jgi:2-amino-4-hydroxy-6-hydroxymethyldihydropteridine diphosphokinase
VSDIAYVALGSNLGNREDNLDQARRLLSGLKGSRLLAESTIEETAPLGTVPQGNFLNQMVAVETPLEPLELMEALHVIEHQLGRVRAARWGPRTIDLDIVLFGDRSISTEKLTIPHPELPRRDFWQRELIELRGDWR